MSLDPQDNGADINDIRVSAAEAATKLQNMLRRPSASHADIRRFIEKEYHKTSAAKELVRHLIFLVVSLYSFVQPVIL